MPKRRTLVGSKGLAEEVARAAAFRTGVRRFLKRTQEVAAEAGLTAERYDLLLMIHSAGELRVTDLCSLLELRQTAVTELVKRAQEVGLLERRPSSTDRRVSLLSLTGEGERRLMQAFRALRDDREAVAASLRALARVAASPDSR